MKIPYIIKVKKKKGMTRGGFARTAGRRVVVYKTKTQAEKVKKRLIMIKTKVPKKRKILRKLIVVKKL